MYLTDLRLLGKIMQFYFVAVANYVVGNRKKGVLGGVRRGSWKRSVEVRGSCGGAGDPQEEVRWEP